MARYPVGTIPPGDEPPPFGPDDGDGRSSDDRSNSGRAPGPETSPPETLGSKRSASGLSVTLTVVLVAGVVLLAVVALAALTSRTDKSATIPPSQRYGSAEVPGPSVDGKGNGKANSGRNGQGSAADNSDGFTDVRCTFTGSSLLTPGIPATQGVASRQKMVLKPGATFKCVDGFGSSSGRVSMSATFPALSATQGVGSGPGLIVWETLPGDAPDAKPEGPRKSTTTNEVELDLPHIFVWITISDGPYAGMRSKLTLDNWEPVMDSAGTIVEARFKPTDFTFAVP